MRIIDRYLLRHFAKTFLMCFFSLFGLIVVFDAFANLDAFMTIADKHGGLAKVMGQHYAYQSILYFDLLSGMVNLAAATFTVSWIQRHNELVALMAAGVSRVRVVLPVIGAAVFVMVLAALNRELVMPRFRDELSRKPKEMVHDAPLKVSPTYDELTDVLLSGENALAEQQKIIKPSFRLPPRSSEQFGKEIAAKEAFYKEAQGDRPRGYLFVAVERPTEIAKRPSLLYADKPVVITPKDRPDWLKPDQCFVVSSVSFEQLTSDTAWRKFSSAAQLIRELHNPNMSPRGDTRAMVHARIVHPLADLTLLFLGLPLVLTREHRNVFIAMGMSVAIALGFMLVTVVFGYCGERFMFGISPALGVWVPLILFVPVAVELAHSMSE